MCAQHISFVHVSIDSFEIPHRESASSCAKKVKLGRDTPKGEFLGNNLTGRLQLQTLWRRRQSRCGAQATCSARSPPHLSSWSTPSAFIHHLYLNGVCVYVCIDHRQISLRVEVFTSCVLWWDMPVPTFHTSAGQTPGSCYERCPLPSLGTCHLPAHAADITINWTNVIRPNRVH